MYKKLVNELLEKHDYLKLKKIFWAQLAFQDERMNDLANKHYNDHLTPDRFGKMTPVPFERNSTEVVQAIDWNIHQDRYELKRDVKGSSNRNLWNYKKLYELMLVHANLKENELWDFMADNWLFIDDDQSRNID
jgi:hypothetical protein